MNEFIINSLTSGTGYIGGVSIVESPTVTVRTVTGTEAKIEQTVNKKGEIHPRLYFSFVKSKLNNFQLTKLKIRLDKLKKMVRTTGELGQKAAFEEFSRQLAVTIRESEAEACGVKGFILKEHIDKFMGLTKNVRFELFEKFPRVVPDNVRVKILYLKERGIFDEYWVLYLDNKEPLKTNKEKIKEKDPILFGKFSYEPNKLYYVIDWIDDYCDLTMDKFVDAMKKQDGKYALELIPDIDQKFVDRIMKDVKDRTDRLNNTKPSNYKELMKEEDTVWNKFKALFRRGKTKKN